MPSPTSFRTSTFVILLVLGLPSGGRALAQGLPVEGASIPVGTWSYEIRVRGVAIGTLAAETRREGTEIVSVSVAATPDRQETTLAADGLTLRPLRSRTVLEASDGTRFEARMSYRATGDSLEVVRQVIDQAGDPRDRYPPLSRWTYPRQDRYDLAGLDLVLAALPLEAGSSWEFHLIDPTSEGAVTVRATVVGKEQLQVPAGTFEVWRVRVTGQALVTEYAIEAAGRRLVAQYIPAQQVAILLRPPTS